MSDQTYQPEQSPTGPPPVGGVELCRELTHVHAFSQGIGWCKDCREQVEQSWQALGNADYSLPDPWCGCDGEMHSCDDAEHTRGGA